MMNSSTEETQQLCVVKTAAYRVRRPPVRMFVIFFLFFFDHYLDYCLLCAGLLVHTWGSTRANASELFAESSLFQGGLEV